MTADSQQQTKTLEVQTMLKTETITVKLLDDDIDLIRWRAKKDGISYEDQLQDVFDDGLMRLQGLCGAAWANERRRAERKWSAGRGTDPTAPYPKKSPKNRRSRRVSYIKPGKA